jgi:hypothetical protein
MFSVAVIVDSEYTPDEHAADIIMIVKRSLTTAAINVVSVKVFEKGMETGSDPSEQSHVPKARRKPSTNN